MKHDLTMRRHITKTAAFVVVSAFCALSPTSLHAEDISVPPAVGKTAAGTGTTNQRDTRQGDALHPSSGEPTRITNLLAAKSESEHKKKLRDVSAIT
jgi:hypothetical protein